jgi:hypothetical protein
VDFSNQTQAQRELSDPLQPVVHGVDVVDDLLHVLGEFLPGSVNLELKYVVQGALRSFDLRTQDGLVPDVHRHEEVGVGQNGSDPIQSPQGSVGVGEQTGQFRVHHHRRVGW